jgi:hypothetical protein
VKKDGGLGPCIDYRAINHINVKENAPPPIMNDLIDRLARASIFSTLDMCSAYNVIRIHEGDQWKAAFRRKFGHFEPKVVSRQYTCRFPKIY